MRNLPLILVFLLFGAAGCTPAEDESGGSEAAVESEETSQTTEAKGTPDSFSETAWMARAEDGARFTTFFDADGTYRDLRNGDPMQSGEWSYAEGPEGKQICFQPDDENGEKGCWQPGSIKDDKLIVTGPEGRRVELQSVDYAPPGEDDAQE